MASHLCKLNSRTCKFTSGCRPPRPRPGYLKVPIINSVDKTRFLYTTSAPTQHHSFVRNYPIHSMVKKAWARVRNTESNDFGDSDLLTIESKRIFY